MFQLIFLEVSGWVLKNHLGSFRNINYWTLPSEIWIQQVSGRSQESAIRISLQIMLTYSQIQESLKSMQIISITSSKHELTEMVIYYFICHYFEKLNTLGFMPLFLSQILILAFVSNLQSVSHMSLQTYQRQISTLISMRDEYCSLQGYQAHQLWLFCLSYCQSCAVHHSC